MVIGNALKETKMLMVSGKKRRSSFIAWSVVHLRVIVFS